MMSIALIVLGRALGRNSLVTFIIGLIMIGMEDCKVPSAYPCQISSKAVSLQGLETNRFRK